MKKEEKMDIKELEKEVNKLKKEVKAIKNGLVILAKRVSELDGRTVGSIRLR